MRSCANLGEALLNTANEALRAADVGATQSVHPALVGETAPTRRFRPRSRTKVANGRADDGSLKALVLDKPKHLVKKKQNRGDGCGVEENEKRGGDRVQGEVVSVPGLRGRRDDESNPGRPVGLGRSGSQ